MRWEVPRRTRPTSSHWGRSRSLSARWVAERGFSPFQPETTEMSAGVAVFPSKRKPRVSTTETHTSGACGLTSKRENWHSSESHKENGMFLPPPCVCRPGASTRSAHIAPRTATGPHNMSTPFPMLQAMWRRLGCQVDPALLSKNAENGVSRYFCPCCVVLLATAAPQCMQTHSM